MSLRPGVHEPTAANLLAGVGAGVGRSLRSFHAWVDRVVRLGLLGAFAFGSGTVAGIGGVSGCGDNVFEVVVR